MDDRIIRVEDAVSRNKQQIDDLGIALQKMQKSIDQIKWMFLGALGAFILSEFGLFAALKIVT